MNDPNSPRVCRTVERLREVVAAARTGGQTIGVVPTMGALHEGHLSLVRRSLERCDRTIVTIFVNPTQFAPHEDFDKYPRTLETDLALLSECMAAGSGAITVFAPGGDQMYPAGFSTYVQPPAVAARWEGAIRPDHFRGVATIVLKLLNLAGADMAFFGQKDFQQALVIRHMVRDLNVLVEIEVCPIVRDPDALAMSSRNRYLSADQRSRALSLPRCLQEAHQAVAAGQRDAAAINDAMQRTLLAGGVDKIDYAAIVDLETLEPLDWIAGDAVAIVAAHVGGTRLIDNQIISVEGRR